MKIVNYVLGSVVFFSLFACEEEEVPVKEDPVKVETVTDLAANPSDEPSPNYTFFSFEEGQLTIADSASTKWDIAFKSTSIIVNGGISGPGSAQAGVAEGIFDDFKGVPSSLSLVSDSESGLAIPSGSGNGWYSYNPSNHLITPLAGKVIFVKTSSGNYAKLEILSYYKGAPAIPGADAVGRYYTFRYAYQPNGSPIFE